MHLQPQPIHSSSWETMQTCLCYIDFHFHGKSAGKDSVQAACSIYAHPLQKNCWCNLGKPSRHITDDAHELRNCMHVKPNYVRIELLPHKHPSSPMIVLVRFFTGRPDTIAVCSCCTDCDSGWCIIYVSQRWLFQSFEAVKASTPYRNSSLLLAGVKAELHVLQTPLGAAWSVWAALIAVDATVSYQLVHISRR